jgi:hypothetical protein
MSDVQGLALQQLVTSRLGAIDDLLPLVVDEQILMRQQRLPGDASPAVDAPLLIAILVGSRCRFAPLGLAVCVPGSWDWLFVVSATLSRVWVRAEGRTAQNV